VSKTSGLALILIVFLICFSGCSTTGEKITTTPSPAQTSVVIVETETRAPLPTTLPLTVTTVPVTVNGTNPPALPSTAKLETGAKKQAYPYAIRELSQFLYYNTYDGVRDYLRDRYPDRPTDFYNVSTLENYYRHYVSDPVQKRYLDAFVENIRKRSELPPERARIAVSLIQHIPYAATPRTLYPYEVLYYDMGKCEDKSILMAYVLSQMGYGTALFLYYPEHHMALGLKCPKQYSTEGSGYCFVETTSPAIMTYSNGTYVGVGRLTSRPEIIKLSDGAPFDQISEEYTDAQSYDAVVTSAVWNGSAVSLDSFDYNQFGYLQKKYGLFDLDLTRIQ
jgi:hypothetical protein